MSRRQALFSAVAAMLAPGTRAWAQVTRPIILGQVSLSFYAVTGAVVQLVLEKLGHEVLVREGPHERMFPLLASSEIDLMAAAWLPEGHADYWKRFGGDAREVATLYDGARFFWAVPEYVPSSSVASIADLAKLDVVERMNKRIQGIGDGATISQVSRRAVESYGLTGYRFEPGTQRQWIAALEAAVGRREWIVFPTWAPQFLNRGERLRALADPRGVLGGTSHASLVAPNHRWRELPEPTRATLARLRLDIDAVTEMDWLVNARGMTPRAAAGSWMASNAATVSAWSGAP
jgi:glycine betaine/proline transport system substrate-binding protein